MGDSALTLPNEPVSGGAEPVEGDETVILPTRGWFDWRLRQVWQYRDLVSLFVWRDFVSIYKQTILGPAWHIVRPLLSAATFTIVFAGVARLSTDGIPPFLFYMSGTVIWSYFATSLDNVTRTFLSNTPLFTKVYFPRLCIPISLILSNVIAFGIQFAIFLVVLVGYVVAGYPVRPTAWIAATPVLLLMLAGFGLGIGAILCALTTRYRDLSYLVAFGIQLLMFLTPVVYPLSAVPEAYRWLAELNPLTPILEAFRLAFLGAGTVAVSELAISFGIMVVLLVVGLELFSRAEQSAIDIV
jgi:lipopolysaccharide transport system permease protein